MNKKEKKMIEAAKSGNEEAFNQLFKYYYQMAYAIAISYTKNDADAKDAVQESFMTIHTAIKDLREVETFPAWLKTVVHSKCYKIFRKKHDIPADPDVFKATSNTEYRKYMDPQENADYYNEREVLYSLIQNLKPKHREVIDLVYLQQLKITEAAAILNISSGTVKTRIHRAKKELSVLIQSFEKENGRKINFHIDGLTSTSIFVSTITALKYQFQRLQQLIKANVLTSSCILTLSVLGIAGVVFAYQDYQTFQQNQTSGKQDNEISELIHENVAEKQPEVKQTFYSVAYQDQWIHDSRTAYFTCLNFAWNQSDMQEHTYAELLEIRPVYEALKQKHDEYYQKLVNDGWTALYEQALSI